MIVTIFKYYLQCKLPECSCSGAEPPTADWTQRPQVIWVHPELALKNWGESPIPPPQKLGAHVNKAGTFYPFNLNSLRVRVIILLFPSAPYLEYIVRVSSSVSCVRNK